MSLDSNIFLIDDDSAVQDALGIFLSVVGLKIETYLSGKFLWFQPVISSFKWPIYMYLSSNTLDWISCHAYTAINKANTDTAGTLQKQPH